MDARLMQNSLELGAMMTLSAVLSEYGIPVDRRAAVRAELQRPDGTQAVLNLAEGEPGVFQVSTIAAMQGVYRFRVVAEGQTMRGLPFSREQQLSGAAVPGGDNTPQKSDTGTRMRDQALCGLLQCLLGPETLGRWFAEHNIDPGLIQKCVEKWCPSRLESPSDEEIRRLEGI
jgi:hypothetical protein